MASLPPAHHCPNTHKCTRVHPRTVPHSLTPSQHLCAVCRHHWRFPQLSICFSLYQFLPSFPCGCESNCKCSLRKEFISARGPSGHGRPGQEHEATHFCSQRAKMDAQPVPSFYPVQSSSPWAGAAQFREHQPCSVKAFWKQPPGYLQRCIS